MSKIHELLKRLHSTNEGETICLNYEEVQYVLQMERIIEDQEKKLETTEGGAMMDEKQEEGGHE